MKKIFTFFLTALFAFITTQSFAQSQRLLMVEEGTQASCPPCASQNPAFDALLDANADRVVVLKYQTSWPGFDQMNQDNPSEVAARVSYYGFEGVPSAYVNGVEVADDCNAYSGAPACLSQAEVTEALAETSPFDLEISGEITDNILTVSGKATATEAVSGNLKLRIALAEKNISSTDAPGGTNGETEFHHVMKKFVPGVEGIDLADTWAVGDVYDINETFDVSALTIYRYDELEVVAFIQNDGDKSIHQAAVDTDIALSSTTTNDAAMLSITDIEGACTGEQTIEPIVRISNTGNDAMTSAVITYNINDGVNQNYTWTGDLGTYIFEDVTLPAYTFTSTGEVDHIVNVSVSNPNGNTDENDANNTSQTTFGAISQRPANTLTIKIYTDDYGCEIYWQFVDISNGAVLASGGNETAIAGGQTITYGAGYSCPAGLGYANNTTYTEEITLPASGCYEFQIIDDWGDGISGSAYVIRNEIGFPLVSGGGFSGASMNHRLDLMKSVGVEDVVEDKSFNAFPNPVQNELNLQFDLLESSEIQVLVYDVLGQVVKSIPTANYGTGINNLQINTADLSNGVYVVTLRTEEGDLSKRVTVSK